MSYKYIKSERHEGVLVITLDDPSTRNALGVEMGREITDELTSFESDDTLRALVITGRDPAFCSGVNLKEISRRVEESEPEQSDAEDYLKPWERMKASLTEASPESGSDALRHLPFRIYNLQKPTIAAVNGYAIGVGMGIAISCDIRIASVEAKMAEAFIRTGLIPGDGSFAGSFQGSLAWGTR